MQKWEYMILERQIHYEQKTGFHPRIEVSYSWADNPEESRNIQGRLNALGQEG